MVSKKGQVTIGVLIVLLIGVIVAITLLPEIANQQHGMTDKLTVTNQSNDVTTARNTTSASKKDWKMGTVKMPQFNLTNNNVEGWKLANCPITSYSVTLFNVTSKRGIALTEGTDYEFSPKWGNFTMKNGTKTRVKGNLTIWNYSYCGDGYILDGAGRSVAKLILVFAALALVAFVIFYGVKEFI